MDFIKELLTEKAKSANRKRPGKPKDGKHDDGTNMMFTKDRPYAKTPKTPNFSLGNMYFNMTNASDRAGVMESQHNNSSTQTFLQYISEWHDDRYFKFDAWAEKQDHSAPPTETAVVAHDLADATKKARIIYPNGSIGDVIEIDQSQFEKVANRK